MKHGQESSIDDYFNPETWCGFMMNESEKMTYQYCTVNYESNVPDFELLMNVYDWWQSRDVEGIQLNLDTIKIQSRDYENEKVMVARFNVGSEESFERLCNMPRMWEK